MTIMGRGAKIFVNDIDITKLLAVTGFSMDLEAGGTATGTIKFLLDDMNVSEGEQAIRIGKAKKETFKKAASERSLIF